MSSKTRIHGFDSLRAILMLLGIVLHVTLSYTPHGFWPFKDPRVQSDSLGAILDWIHLFRMPLFFLLSGYFSAMLWSTIGIRNMIKHRLLRIVLPFLLFVIILNQLNILGTIYSIGLLGGYENPLKNIAYIYPEYSNKDVVLNFIPELTWHLWFIYYLIIITIFFITINVIIQYLNISIKTFNNILNYFFKNILYFIFVLGILNFFYWSFFKWTGIPDASAYWIPDISQLFYFLFFYFIGWIIFNNNYFLGNLEKHCVKIICAAFIFYFLRIGGLLTENILFMKIGGSFALAAFIPGLMGIFLRYANTGSTAWRYISDSSYWIFLIHLPLTLLIPPLLLNWDLPLIIKYPLAIFLVTIFSFLTYNAFVRSFFISKFINGRTFETNGKLISFIGSLIFLVWITHSVINPLPVSERPSPWKGGQDISDLLKNETFSYPVNFQLKESNSRFLLSQCVEIKGLTLCPNLANYHDARDACKLGGGDLVKFLSLKNASEFNQLIRKFLSKPVWLGLNEVNQDDWRWEDGSSPTFDFWAYGEPNDHGGNDEKCAAMNISPSQEGFYDFPCEANLGFVCKF